MKPKLLYQNVDVVSLAGKCIVVRCFVCRNFAKFSWRRESCDNIRLIKMDSCLVLTECLSRRILRFSISPIDLIHSERVSSSTSSFFTHHLAYASHASMVMSKFWCHFKVQGHEIKSDRVTMSFNIRERYTSYCSIRSPNRP